MNEAPIQRAAESFFSKHWEKRLDFIVDLMRRLSAEKDPQKVVELYGSRMKAIIGYDMSMSLSRRDLVEPNVRITRTSIWEDNVNPWKDKNRLPIVSGGILRELMYGEEPVIIDELVLPPEDPAAEYFKGMR